MRFEVELTDRTILCSEMTVKHYKDFLKAVYGDEPDYISFMSMFVPLLKELTDLTQDEIYNLSIIDTFLIILELRMFALGGTCRVTIQLENDGKANLELSLAGISDDIKAIDYKKFNTTLKQKRSNILISPPNIQRLAEEFKEGEEYLHFIASVETTDTHQIHNIPDLESAILVSNTLSPKINLQISKLFEEYIREITSIDLLARYKVQNRQLKFVPTFKQLMWFVKLFFSEPLNTLYDNIFYLSYKANMNSEYIESCTPGEYIYFIKKLEQILHEQSQQQNQESSQNDLYNEM